MKAKDLSGQAPGGKRTRLADALPLGTPFVVQIFPVYACTFKCNYCIFSIDPAKRGFISDKVMMDLDLYKRCIDNMTTFPDKIKTLRFVGIGEPLLHPDIAEMVKYAVEKNVANTVEILTNASLLTPTMSDALISAGMTRLVVSTQGTSKQKYHDACGVDLDFDKFIENLSYFYNKKGNLQMYIKLIDCALDGKDDEQKFYKIFGDICDTIAIEHTLPIHSGIDYDKMIKNKDMPLTQFGLPVSNINICPQPFFTMQINPDGKVVPCYSFEYPGIMGDCNKESVTDIWKGKIFQQFRQAMLVDKKNGCKVCTDCKISQYRMFPEDILDNDTEKFKKYYAS